MASKEFSTVSRNHKKVSHANDEEFHDQKGVFELPEDKVAMMNGLQKDLEALMKDLQI